MMAVSSSELIDIQAHKISAHTTPSPLLWSSRLTAYVKGADYEYVPRTILDEVTAYIPSGRLTAIMGSSGSGKTTLLNVLAGRDRESNLRSSGYATYNGLEKPKNVRIAYVTQQDTLPHNLSVREALQYAAELRSVWERAHQRNSVVEGVLSRLGLTRCANTIIGKEGEKGCSGGEKRRISIAVQLLTGASALFCDEPTSGLDSATALQVVQTLKHLVADALEFHDCSLWEALRHIVSDPAILLYRYQPPSLPVALYFATWIAFQATLFTILPGTIAIGQPTPAGERLCYRLNGFKCWLITVLTSLLLWVTGVIDLHFIASNWSELLSASTYYAWILAVLALVKAHLAPSHLMDRKFSGNFFTDLYNGIELNPRVGKYWDVKLFHNGHCAMTGWTSM
ncbi:P-loop containing nucleoside triphosphate hydrolase protein [Aspergillus novoparasiticus]|uniref:P-loop containing nucleoside triphosphate hydrolase protein n=1 Tax=Aspergillus novoparasiticus TaxID=986946 RepID=A0A5N6ET59_9EURO|nr:P-loop containing nucleoside triphosphate hydrolase protein [Aspergillus novoparasiticus]